MAATRLASEYRDAVASAIAAHATEQMDAIRELVGLVSQTPPAAE